LYLRKYFRGNLSSWNFDFYIRFDLAFYFILKNMTEIFNEIGIGLIRILFVPLPLIILLIFSVNFLNHD